jgi:ribosomal protein S10
MPILSRAYLYLALNSTTFKKSCLGIIYKILIMFSYNFLFNLKILTVNTYGYRIYILNTNYAFLFVDCMYLLSYFSNLSRSLVVPVGLPIKKKSYSILRSPFIYSKSKESFLIQFHSFFFELIYTQRSEILLFFYTKLLSNIALNGSKLSYKRRLTL